MHMLRSFAAAVTIIVSICGVFAVNAVAQEAKPTQPPAAEQPAMAQPPQVGEQAIAFELSTLDTPAQSIALESLRKDGPVVLVVLRGWPGYQCPICTRQVQDLLKHTDAIEKAGATVVLVYPGPAEELKSHADEFIEGNELPDRFKFVIDPDYTFTNAWHLRWDAPKETAYPSTFVIDRDNVVQYQKVSKTHGGRAKTEEVVAAVTALPTK